MTCLSGSEQSITNLLKKPEQDSYHKQVFVYITTTKYKRTSSTSKNGAVFILRLLIIYNTNKLYKNDIINRKFHRE